MEKVKHKILCGYPANNGLAYAMHIEDYGVVFVKEKQLFDNFMMNGFIEVGIKQDCVPIDSQRLDFEKSN